jgi:hypothetical protein
MAIKKIDNKIQPILLSALTLTTSWQDIATVSGGPFVDLKDCIGCALYIKLVIHNSTGVQFRLVAADTDAATDLYEAQNKDVQAAVTNLAPSILQLSNNVDQNAMISFTPSDQMPVGKFQAKVLVAGVTPAQITAAGVTFTFNQKQDL